MKYKIARDAFFAKLHAYLSSKEDFFKAEILFESLKDWSEKDSIDDIRSWFMQCAKHKSLDLENIPLDLCRGWDLDKNGYYSHESGSSFICRALGLNLQKQEKLKEDGISQ